MGINFGELIMWVGIGLLVWLVIGLVTGWLAGLALRRAARVSSTS